MLNCLTSQSLFCPYKNNKDYQTAHLECLSVNLPVSLFVCLYICGHGPWIYPALFPLVPIRFSLYVIRKCNQTNNISAQQNSLSVQTFFTRLLKCKRIENVQNCCLAFLTAKGLCNLLFHISSGKFNTAVTDTCHSHLRIINLTCGKR